MAQIQELQDKVNSLYDSRGFYDSETASSSGLSHVPSQPVSIPNPRGMIGRDPCLQPDTRNSLGTSGHVFEGLLARGEPSSALFVVSHNSAVSSCRLKPSDSRKIAEKGERVRKEPQGLHNTNSSHCQEVFDLEPSVPYRRNFSKLYDGNLKNQISDLHFDKLIPWHIRLHSGGRPILRLKYALVLVVLQTQCCGSKK